jgi:hypothetical protein
MAIVSFRHKDANSPPSPILSMRLEVVEFEVANSHPRAAGAARAVGT